MNLPIPIFRNEINALGDFKGGVKVARDFARPIIAGLRSSGIDTLTGLANALNERGIKTGQGGRWYPQTVKRVVEARA